MKTKINFINIIMGSFLLFLFSCKESSNIKMIESNFIYEKPPFIECHASSIEELSDGNIVIAAFGGTKEKNKDVTIWLSKKGTDKWQSPKLIADGIINDTLRYPTWNPVLYRTMSDILYLYYKVGPSPREWWGEYIFSTDQGENWSEIVRLPDSILGPIKNKPIELSKGIILSPSSTETKTLEKYIWKSHIEKSTDNGENWTKIPIDHNSEFNVIQPTILVHSKDTIQVLNRSRENKIISSFSYDSGESWTDLKPLELNNPNSGVDGVTLKNGTHLLVYNPNINGRSKLVLSESDDGINWTDKLILEDEETGEFSYPAIIEASDGLVHISYTFNRRNIKHVVIEVN